MGLGQTGLAGAQAQAELRIVALVAVTGAASVLGAPERNAIERAAKASAYLD